MDYEKKYNDALNLAKSYYGEGCNEFLDTIFPELAESEDERIRKAIIELLKEVGRDDTGISENVKCMIAYLEKQKEQKPYEPKNWPADKDNLTQEQRPAEWHPTHEQMVALNWAAIGINNNSPCAGDIKASLRSLYNDLKSKSISPAEWSEEDEKRIKQLIYDTEAIRAGYEKKKEELGDRFNNVLIKDCDEQISWLKSLRPQPHWKPSEEQMDAIRHSIHIERDNEDKRYYAGMLESLFYDLKKLM